MAKNEAQICVYLETMAAKVGGNVKAYKNVYGDYTLQRLDSFGKSVRVSMEESRESFNDKVIRLMGGK